MNRRTFVRLAPAAVAVVVAAGAPLATAQVAVDSNAAAALISALRAQRGVAAVTANSQLTNLARNQARGMARADVLSHSIVGDFPARLGTRFGIAAENIAVGAPSLAAVIDQWMGSRVHRNNMLNPAFSIIGMASDVSRSQRTYFALILASG